MSKITATPNVLGGHSQSRANQEVVKLLESLLDDAQAGRIDAFAYVGHSRTAESCVSGATTTIAGEHLPMAHRIMQVGERMLQSAGIRLRPSIEQSFQALARKD